MTWNKAAMRQHTYRAPTPRKMHPGVIGDVRNMRFMDTHHKCCGYHECSCPPIGALINGNVPGELSWSEARDYLQANPGKRIRCVFSETEEVVLGRLYSYARADGFLSFGQLGPRYTHMFILDCGERFERVAGDDKP